MTAIKDDFISTAQIAACDYRVIDFGMHFAVHEVYYDEDGKPVAYAQEPAVMVADAAGGWTILSAIADAVECDALDVSVFTKGDA